MFYRLALKRKENSSIQEGFQVKKQFNKKLKEDWFMSLLLETGAPIVTVFGGSGFIGRYVVSRMAKLGWRVKVAVRNPNHAIFLKTYGEVGQIEILQSNVLSQSSVLSATEGSMAVINCVAGKLMETNSAVSRRIYVDAANFISKAASLSRVKKLVHISALGASIGSESFYSRHKAKGEQKVLENFPSATILRPSVVFGFEDQFFNRFASMAAISPVIPLIGSKSKFQPIFVDDIALAVEKAVGSEKLTGIFELGGPEILSFRELMEQLLIVIRRRRVVLSVPFAFGNVMAFCFLSLKKATLGLFSPPITADNIINLKSDNVVSKDVKTVKDLNINPKAIMSIIPQYLYSYRPNGQYSEITDSQS